MPWPAIFRQMEDGGLNDFWPRRLVTVEVGHGQRLWRVVARRKGRARQSARGRYFFSPPLPLSVIRASAFCLTF